MTDKVNKTQFFITSSCNAARYAPYVATYNFDELKAKPVRKNEEDTLLSVIFAPNPRTGLPSSDVAVYLSKKTNPAVREFIANNLLRPTNARNLLPADFSEDLSDFQRGEYETAFEYSKRVGKLLSDMNSKDVESKTE